MCCCLCQLWFKGRLHRLSKCFAVMIGIWFVCHWHGWFVNSLISSNHRLPFVLLSHNYCTIMHLFVISSWYQKLVLLQHLNCRLPKQTHTDCNKVRRKEGSGQGWLVKTQVCLFKTDKLTQVRTLRHPETSTLSFVSAITLCIRSDCFSLTARAPESSLRLSLWTAVPRRLLSGLHANYCNQTQVILVLHLTHLLTAVSWVFLPLQTSLNHAPLATYPHRPTHLEDHLWITLNLKGCNARYQRVIRALVSFMRWSHCKGAWSEQRVNSRPRR